MSEFLKLAEYHDREADFFHRATGASLTKTIYGRSAAALRKADALQEAYTNLGSERDLLLLECENLRWEIARLQAELSGKKISPEVTTMCQCEDCGAGTRWGRHLDMDCKTIAEQRDTIAILLTTLNRVRALANEGREDLGVEMFQVELRDICGMENK